MKKPVKNSDMKSTTDGAASAAELDAKAQTELFAKAMKLFAKGHYGEAKPLFDQASGGPKLSVNESAIMYGRMCGQRLAQEHVALKTADDHYNYAVSLMNLRRLEEAAASLRKAIDLGDAGHIRYAMSLATGLQGDTSTAATHLQRAIELDPTIRTAARNDPDFQPLLQDHAIRELVTGEKS